ncbi:MAG: hypothetical protein EBS06_02570 [Proteobacteria bacterium]|nr:hypothetical protein [Pseudomonadota bacterium]
MKIVKISCAGSTLSWPDHSNPMVFKFLPSRSNIWKNCQFFWNDTTIKKADHWIIIGDIEFDEEECEVDPRNIILMTGEPRSIKSYDDSSDFVKQFGRVYSSQENFKHNRAFPCRPPINWWIDGGSPIKSKEEFQKWQGDGLGYNDFKNLRQIKKEKLLSVFCSNKIFTQGHKARFNFCQKLKNHFKDKIDWFGIGVRPIDSKWQGIAPYKYHIALENSQSPDYWTEKLIDPLMVLTHPIYCGATNINNYFTDAQVTEIDIKYPKTAIAKIEKLIFENFYEKNFEQLFLARDLVMDKYNAFNLISDIIENDSVALNPKKMKVKKERFFLLQKENLETACPKNPMQKFLSSSRKRLTTLKNFLTDYFLLIKLKIS